MRISDRQIFGRQTRLINRNRAEHARLQDQAASGKRVSRPSDDPSAFGRISEVNHRLAAVEGHRTNASAARTKLQTAESAIFETTDNVARAVELTVRSLNGSLNADNRSSIAAEIRTISQHLRGVAETRLDGQYIFSGTSTDTPPLASDGSYQGGGQGNLVKVGQGQPVDIAIDGSSIFAGPGNLIGLLDELATALDANDVNAVGAKLDGLKNAQDQVINAQTDIGARISRVNLSETLSEEIDFRLQKERGELQDADIASVISELVSREQSLQAAVQVAGRSLQPSLLDVL